MGLYSLITAGSTSIAVWSLEELTSGLSSTPDTHFDLPPRYSPRAIERAAVISGLSSLNHYETVAHHPNGRPYLEDTKLNISVSHAGRFVAVALDKEDYIGVDIEQTDRKFRRVASRYLSPLELEWICTDSHQSMALAWCIKESIYKLPWVAGKSFTQDIKISPFSNALTEGNLVVEVSNGCDIIRLLSNYRFFDGYCLVWVCAKKVIFQ